MTHISETCNPFEVRGEIVGFDPIHVVNLMSDGPCPDEDFCDESVDTEVSLRVIKTDPQVSFVVEAGSKHDTTTSFASVIYAPNTPQRRDFVSPFVVRHGTPFFGKIVGSHRGPPAKVPWSGSAGTFAASRRADPYYTTREGV